MVRSPNATLSYTSESTPQSLMGRCEVLWTAPQPKIEADTVRLSSPRARYSARKAGMNFFPTNLFISLPRRGPTFWGLQRQAR